MQIVCINDYAGEVDSEILTYGKIYEGDESWDEMSYSIMADNNVLTNVVKNRFTTVDKWREMKLTALLE
jgi:hypothetical protein